MIETLKRVEKPWGYELWWARTDRYVGKVIHVNKGHALSLQYHNRKDETIFVWAGKILFERQEGDALVAPRTRARRRRARHAADRAPDDGARGQRHLRSLDARDRRRRAPRRPLRAAGDVGAGTGRGQGPGTTGPGASSVAASGATAPRVPDPEPV